jgi:CubicO group peptidase (beta-lactamase class C family)
MHSFDDAYHRIADHVTRQMRIDGTPGLSLAVTDRDRLLHVATFGHADVAAQSSVKPETLFEIGSIGKSFAAIVLLQLQEEGRVEVMAPVTEYIPWFHVRSVHEPITLHHLLSHTGGISCGVDFSPEAIFQIWTLRDMDASAPPGTFFHYSNLGYKVLGHVVERVTGQRFPEVVQSRIFDPLGMTTAVPEITHALRPRLATGYVPLFNDRPAPPDSPLVPAIWVEGETADGSLVMSAGDLATYLRMLLNCGAYPGGRLLSSEGFDLLTQRVIQSVEGDEPRFYCYGLGIYDAGGHLYIGHGGGMVGYFAGMLGDIDAGLGAVVLVNGPGSPGLLGRAVIDHLRAVSEGSEPPDLPTNPDKTIANAADFAGTYRGGDQTLTVCAEGDGLTLSFDEIEVPLTPYYGTDTFLADHPRFDRYFFGFARSGRSDGQVVEVFHGPTWLVNERYDGPKTFDHPSDWLAYPGRYRSHNPWLPIFVLVLRKGQLWQILPAGADGFDDEQLLVPLPDGSFPAGKDERGPERIRFDTIIDGKAVHANLSGGDYYRVGPA